MTILYTLLAIEGIVKVVITVIVTLQEKGKVAHCTGSNLVCSPLLGSCYHEGHPATNELRNQFRTPTLHLSR